jgi:hypothetical protein
VEVKTSNASLNKAKAYIHYKEKTMALNIRKPKQ